MGKTGRIGKVGLEMRATEGALEEQVRLIMEDLPELMSISEAERFTVYSHRCLQSMCARGEISAVKVGKRWLIHRDPFMEAYGIPMISTRLRRTSASRRGA